VQATRPSPKWDLGPRGGNKKLISSSKESYRGKEGEVNHLKFRGGGGIAFLLSTEVKRHRVEKHRNLGQSPKEGKKEGPLGRARKKSRHFGEIKVIKKLFGCFGEGGKKAGKRNRKVETKKSSSQIEKGAPQQ